MTEQAGTQQKIEVAYTPDSDDAFYYYGLELGLVADPCGFRFHREHIADLNRAAVDGIYDVTAISSVAYPSVARQYRILSVGTSVGRGYGPVLVSRGGATLAELGRGRIAVAGIPSTGATLARLVCPDAELVRFQFDRIGAAVACGRVDAGVMIHEELIYYSQLGLHCVTDLGQHWCHTRGLPLPVGLNVARRDLGPQRLDRICEAIRESLLYGLRHRAPALDWVSQFGRGRDAGCTHEFVAKFANRDSLVMPHDVRAGLEQLLRESTELTGEAFPPIDIVAGSNRDPMAA